MIELEVNEKLERFATEHKPIKVAIGGRVSGKYKVNESLKMDDISVFSVNDSNIKMDLDKEWKNSGSYLDKDYISENEIWLSQDLSDVKWAETLKEELVKLDSNLDAPMQEFTPTDQLMYPEILKKKKDEK